MARVSVSLNTVRPEPVEGAIGFGRLSPNGNKLSPNGKLMENTLSFNVVALINRLKNKLIGQNSSC
jgi:hypothetical protein